MPGPVKDRGALPARWSPAHHRVLQHLLPLRRRHGVRAGALPAVRPWQEPVRIGDGPGPHLGQGRGGGPGQRAQCAERGRQPGVRPVQQPGHDQRGGQVHRRHRRPGVMPGVPVPRRRGEVPGVPRVRHVRRVCRVPRHRRGRVAVGAGQRQMQHSLCGQREHDGRGRRVAPPRERPHRCALGHDQRAQQPPGHRLFGDRVVAEDGEHGAEHGEQSGPRARSRTAGRTLSGTPVTPGRHGRASLVAAGALIPSNTSGRSGLFTAVPGRVIGRRPPVARR